jgi:hypothetical protein
MKVTLTSKKGYALQGEDALKKVESIIDNFKQTLIKVRRRLSDEYNPQSEDEDNDYNESSDLEDGYSEIDPDEENPYEDQSSEDESDYDNPSEEGEEDDDAASLWLKQNSNKPKETVSQQ